MMKIGLAADVGGHLTQMDAIITKETLKNHEVIYFTKDNPRANKIKYKKYLFKEMGYNPLKYILPILRCYRIMRKEKIKILITTGAEMGLITVIAGKLLGIKTVYIDSIICTKTPTLPARLGYFFIDELLIQNKSALKRIGKKAKYVGGIL
tara:strand:- start:44 stop:496 length:453 start_codon:yes stop_codon:yes gene_type:complete